MSVIERRVLLPSGTPLPVFPAFVSAGPLDIPELTDNITYYVTYTGGPADRPVFRVFYGNEFVATITPSEDGRDTVIDAGSFVVSPPNGDFDFWLSQPRGPTAASGITYVIGCKCIPGGVKRVTLDVADAAVAGSSVQVTVTGAGPS